MVYHSDSDSDLGDPKHRIGSRFSSYYGDENKANKQENSQNQRRGSLEKSME